MCTLCTKHARRCQFRSPVRATTCHVQLLRKRCAIGGRAHGRYRDRDTAFPYVDAEPEEGLEKVEGVASEVEYAVTGSTGAMGGRVAARLAERGIVPRLIVRDPARAPHLPGAEVAQAEYGDGPAMRRALEGVHTLFMVSGSEAFDRVQQH